VADLSRVQTLIVKHCDRIKELLLRKNRQYGNSALEPIGIFASKDPVQGILFRIDDKLSRIRTSGRQGDDEKTDDDLTGYLILLMVAEELAAEQRLLAGTIGNGSATSSVTTISGPYQSETTVSTAKVHVKIE
jgi:hypothetical protein